MRATITSIDTAVTTTNLGRVTAHTPLEVQRLVALARRLNGLARRYAAPGAPIKPGYDVGPLVKRMRAYVRVIMDDARQAKHRRPKANRCDDRFGYGWHVCAKDDHHTGDCRCRCGEEFNIYPF